MFVLRSVLDCKLNIPTNGGNDKCSNMDSQGPLLKSSSWTVFPSGSLTFNFRRSIMFCGSVLDFLLDIALSVFCILEGFIFHTAKTKINSYSTKRVTLKSFLFRFMDTYNSHLNAIARSITKKQLTPAERKTLLQSFAHQISDLRGTK